MSGADDGRGQGVGRQLEQAVAEGYRTVYNENPYSYYPESRERTATVSTNAYINNSEIDVIVAEKHKEQPGKSRRYVVECKDHGPSGTLVKPKAVWKTIALAQYVGGTPVIVTTSDYTGPAERIARQFGVTTVQINPFEGKRIKNLQTRPIFDQQEPENSLPDILHEQEEWIRDQTHHDLSDPQKYENKVHHRLRCPST